MVQKKFLRKGLAGLLTVAMVTGLFPVYYKPMTAKAEETAGIRSVNLDTSYLAPSDGTWDAENDHKVYFGKYGDTPTVFRVLKVEDNQIMLDCDTILVEKEFDADKVVNEGQSNGNLNGWKNSDLEKWLNGTDYYDSDDASVFIFSEKNAIVLTTLLASESNYLVEENEISCKDYETTDYVYLLSAKEANTLYANNEARKKANAYDGYWLRSATDSTGYVGIVGYAGQFSDYGVDNRGTGVSPVLNLNQSSVLFTSLSGIDKSSAFALTTDAMDNKTWNLTLAGGIGFSATLGETALAPGGEVSVQVNSLGTLDVGKNGWGYTQISAMLVDSNDSVLAYGKIGNAGASTVTFNLPDGITVGNYVLKVFGEAVIPDATYNRTSFASNMVSFDVSVTEPPEHVGSTYLLKTAEDLMWFANAVNSGQPNIGAFLMDNIDLQNTEWTPIGSEANSYAGVFKGNGKQIWGLNVNATTDYAGMFGYLNGAEIEDLRINGKVSSTAGCVGGVFGYAKDATISGCVNNAEISSNGNFNGGIGGKAEITTIKDCTNNGLLKAGQFQNGGILGTLDRGVIFRCINNGKITVADHAGGIVGWVSAGGIVKSCCNIADVSNTNSTYTYVGGIAGECGGMVGNCYNTGLITGVDREGCFQGSIAAHYSGDGKTSDTNYSNQAYGVGDSGIVKEDSAFTSGEITWLLNHESSIGDWKQIITHGMPPTFTGDTVYKVASGYANVCDHSANTTTQDCENTVECSICLAVLPAIGHSYGSYTSNGDGTHTRICANNPAHTETEDCVEDAGTITKNPTETETGIRTYKCSVCDGIMRTEEIPVIGSVAAPTADLPTDSEYTEDKIVMLTTATEGAKIYYTMSTDGTEPKMPTVSDILYEASGITLTKIAGKNMVYKIKAIAVKEGMTASAVASFAYTMKDHTTDSGSTGGGNAGGATGGSTGGGHYSGGGSTGGGSYVPVPDVAITLPSETQPDAPITGEIKLEGTTDSAGNTVIFVTEENINDMYYKTLAAAKKSGKEKNGITLVFKVENGKQTANSIKVNLPEAVQKAVIAKAIANIVVVADNPKLKLVLDLQAVKTIHEKAQADVNITAVRLDNKVLTGEAKKIIANRPVLDFRVNYGKGLITDFGSGSVRVEIPYIPAAEEKAENLRAVYVDDAGKVTWIKDSYYDITKKAVCLDVNHFSAYGIGCLRELSGAEVCELKNLPLMRAKGREKDAAVDLYWGKVKDADGYEAYWSYCDGSKNYKKLIDTTEQNVKHRKLNTKKSYKYFVAAYKQANGQKVYLAKSPTLHVAMEKDEYTNAVKVTVEKPEVILKVNKTAKIKPDVVKQDKTKKLLAHTEKYRYYTTNKKTAAVSKNGKIIAKKKGSCYIYVVANNGYYKKVKVTVK